VQLYLNFLDIPVPDTWVWERLNQEQQATVIAAWTRLMIKAAAAPDPKENDRD
jgi:hypothetical protein